MAGSDSYSVSTPTGVCAVSGEAIPVGEACMSVLAEPPEADGLVRLDVAIDAWDRGDRPSFPGPVVGVWRTVIPEKDAPRRQLVGEEEVIDLFEQLGEPSETGEGETAQSRSRQIAFRYLLCLILIRKRKLVWVDAVPATEDGPGMIRVHRPKEKDGDPIEVIDPGMDDDAIRDATRQLSMVMNLDEQETA